MKATRTRTTRSRRARVTARAGGRDATRKSARQKTKPVGKKNMRQKSKPVGKRSARKKTRPAAQRGGGSRRPANSAPRSAKRTAAVRTRTGATGRSTAKRTVKATRARRPAAAGAAGGAAAVPRRRNANRQPPAASKTRARKVVPEEAGERAALTPGNATREQCLERYLPLVRYVVERVASGIPRHVDHEDLVSAGVLGLLNAYDKFDSGKGTKFETYAVWRIRGAVLDQLRSLDWASRSTRRMGREMESCARALDQRLGRTATDQEIARAMQLKLADYHRLMDKVRGSALVSLDETRHGDEGDTLGLAELLEDPRTPDVLANIEQEETKSFLHATLNRLPEQERLVMALYYYEQMTLREIGEALGISESRVSQIHTRAVERLRGRVGRALAG